MFQSKVGLAAWDDQIRCISFVAILVVASIGCGKSPAATATSKVESNEFPKSSETTAAENSTAAEPVASDSPIRTAEMVPADESLTSDEYLRLGVPAHDREWSGNDLMTAEKILATMAKDDSNGLPRFQSSRSGDLFARITSPQNFGILKDQTLPIGLRIPDAMNAMQAINEISKLYLQAFTRKKAGMQEIVEMTGTQLRLTAVTCLLLDEFLPTLNKDDPKYAVRMQGLDQVKRGLAVQISGSLTLLTDNQSDKVVAVSLMKYMQETLPFILPRLTQESRTEILLRLDKMEADPTLGMIQPEFVEFLSAVRNSTDSEIAP